MNKGHTFRQEFGQANCRVTYDPTCPDDTLPWKVVIGGSVTHRRGSQRAAMVEVERVTRRYDWVEIPA
jgi:hypothetical protein